MAKTAEAREHPLPKAVAQRFIAWATDNLIASITAGVTIGLQDVIKSRSFAAIEQFVLELVVQEWHDEPSDEWTFKINAAMLHVAGHSPNHEHFGPSDIARTRLQMPGLAAQMLMVELEFFTCPETWIRGEETEHGVSFMCIPVFDELNAKILADPPSQRVWVDVLRPQGFQDDGPWSIVEFGGERRGPWPSICGEGFVVGMERGEPDEVLPTDRDGRRIMRAYLADPLSS